MIIELPSGSTLILTNDEVILDVFHRIARKGMLIGIIAASKQIYYHDNKCIYKWGDETVAEYPKIYRSVKVCFNSCEKDDFKRLRLRPSIWISSMVGYKKLDRYLQMTGMQYTGCPTQ